MPVLLPDRHGRVERRCWCRVPGSTADDKEAAAKALCTLSHNNYTKVAIDRAGASTCHRVFFDHNVLNEYADVEKTTGCTQLVWRCNADHPPEGFSQPNHHATHRTHATPTRAAPTTNLSSDR